MFIYSKNQRKLANIALDIPNCGIRWDAANLNRYLEMRRGFNNWRLLRLWVSILSIITPSPKRNELRTKGGKIHFRTEAKRKSLANIEMNFFLSLAHPKITLTIEDLLTKSGVAFSRIDLHLFRHQMEKFTRFFRGVVDVELGDQMWKFTEKLKT